MDCCMAFQNQLVKKYSDYLFFVLLLPNKYQVESRERKMPPKRENSQALLAKTKQRAGQLEEPPWTWSSQSGRILKLPNSKARQALLPNLICSQLSSNIK